MNKAQQIIEMFSDNDIVECEITSIEIDTESLIESTDKTAFKVTYVYRKDGQIKDGFRKVLANDLNDAKDVFSKTMKQLKIVAKLKKVSNIGSSTTVNQTSHSNPEPTDFEKGMDKMKVDSKRWKNNFKQGMAKMKSDREKWNSLYGKS